MKLISVGLGIVNSTIGNLKENYDIILDYIKQAKSIGTNILVLPEMVLCGYPVEDLNLWKQFVDCNIKYLENIIDHTKNITVVLGHLINHNSMTYNCASVISDKKLLGITFKENLPTYDVFYEGRTLSSGRENFVVDVSEIFEGLDYKVLAGDVIYRIGDLKIGVEICEDMWTAHGPSRRRAYSGAEIIINCSASPFRAGVNNVRKGILRTRSADYQATYVYSNMIGGNGRLIFDGTGYIYQCGKKVYEVPAFKEGLYTCNIDLDQSAIKRTEQTTFRENVEDYLSVHEGTKCLTTEGINNLYDPENNSINEIATNYSYHFHFKYKKKKNYEDDYYQNIISALILGTHDYYTKTGVFDSMVIGLSGGKDSALCTFIAREVMKKIGANKGFTGAILEEFIRSKVKTFYLSTKHSSKNTFTLSKKLANSLNVDFRFVNIQEEFELQLKKQKEMLEIFNNKDLKLSDIAYQNIQSRIRGSMLWNYSNTTNAMIIVTSNFSEVAVGYYTIGGDSEGCFAPIINLPKTVILDLLEYITNKYDVPVINEINKQKPTAELKDDQEDELELMPYEILDHILFLYSAMKKTPLDIVKLLDSSISYIQRVNYVKKFLRLFFASQYKREQLPVGLKIFNIDLDPKTGFRFPVVQSNSWLELENI